MEMYSWQLTTVFLAREPENSQPVNFFEKKRSNTSRSLHNTYLKGFVKKNLKKKRIKKKVPYMQKKPKKVAHVQKNIYIVFFGKKLFWRVPKSVIMWNTSICREAKKRSNTSSVAKNFFRKKEFFFPKTLHVCKKKLAYMHIFQFYFFANMNRIIYNTKRVCHSVTHFQPFICIIFFQE
ncbi:hypothetical protein LXL04_039606 [Taraxacum kok-saghyz]